MTDALDPTLHDLLKLTAKVEGKEQTYTDLPAKVLAYDATTQTVTVQPLVLVPRNGTLRPVGILQQVQVRWPAGTTWSIVGDLTPTTAITGSFGWLRFAGADISAWKMQATEQDPTAIPRQGAKSDAYFEPGSQPVSVPLAADAYKAGALVIKAAQLLLGDSAATLAAARDTDPTTPHAQVLLWMASVETLLNAAAGSPPGPPVVNPSYTTITAMGQIAATTTKVKIS